MAAAQVLADPCGGVPGNLRPPASAAPAEAQTETETTPSSADLPPHFRWGCFIGHIFSRVDADGNVYGCCSCSYPLGNVGASSFSDIWYGPDYRSFRHHVPGNAGHPPDPRPLQLRVLPPPRRERGDGAGAEVADVQAPPFSAHRQPARPRPDHVAALRFALAARRRVLPSMPTSPGRIADKPGAPSRGFMRRASCVVSRGGGRTRSSGLAPGWSRWTW